MQSVLRVLTGLAGGLPRPGRVWLLLGFCLLLARPVAATHVRELLRADGTVRLGTGFSGSVDVSGFGVVLDPKLGPVFRAGVPVASPPGWSALGSGTNGTVLALAVIGNDLYVGGYFDTAGGVSVSNIAKWNGTSWSALGAGVNDVVYALAVIGNDLYVGGYFDTAGGNPANYIAKWSGSAWSALTSGMNDIVTALAVIGSDLYVGGDFTTAGGNPAKYIAKWNGSAWSPLGVGVTSSVSALAVSGSDLYAGGASSRRGAYRRILLPNGTAQAGRPWDRE